MAVDVRGSRDEVLDAIVAVLESYLADRPDARIATYRYSPYSVRVRVVDPAFAGMSRSRQNDLVWDYLDRLSEDEQGDINMCLILAPDEVETSLGNFEFEHPSPPFSLKAAKAD